MSEIKKNFVAVNNLRHSKIDSNAKTKKKENDVLQGIHTYDILKNPQYTEAFQYVAVQVPDGF